MSIGALAACSGSSEPEAIDLAEVPEQVAVAEPDEDACFELIDGWVGEATELRLAGVSEEPVLREVTRHAGSMSGLPSHVRSTVAEYASRIMLYGIDKARVWLQAEVELGCTMMPDLAAVERYAVEGDRPDGHTECMNDVTLLVLEAVENHLQTRANPVGHIVVRYGVTSQEFEDLNTVTQEAYVVLVQEGETAVHRRAAPQLADEVCAGWLGVHTAAAPQAPVDQGLDLGNDPAADEHGAVEPSGGPRSDTEVAACIEQAWPYLDGLLAAEIRGDHDAQIQVYEAAEQELSPPDLAALQHAGNFLDSDAPVEELRDSLEHECGFA
jgi:hypothetical protein